MVSSLTLITTATHKKTKLDKMKYLIITKNNQPFYTNWFDYDNLYNPDVMVCIFDLLKGVHTFDGKTWIKTEEDNL